MKKISKPGPPLKKMPKLPAGVLFHHDLNLMVFRPRGVLNPERVDAILAFLEAAEDRAEKPFNRFSDLSRLDAIDLDFQHVFRVALHRRLSYANRPPVKSAFYVTSEVTARLVKVHAVLNYSPLRVEMFEELPAAAKWLGVSLEDLKIGS